MDGATSQANTAWSALRRIANPVRRYPKLNIEQRRQLSEDLHRRMELLRELAVLSIKGLCVTGFIIKPYCDWTGRCTVITYLAQSCAVDVLNRVHL